MPLTHESDAGYHIAVPDGWSLSTLGGEVVVESRPSATEAVEVYPALQTNGLTPQGFFTAFLALKEQQAESAGHPLTIQPESPQAGMPVDSFTGTLGGQVVTGVATVLQIPLATQGASSELVFLAEWAPTASFPSEEDRLAAIGHCYGPETASLFRVFKDQVFTYIMPPDGTVADESQDNIDLHLGAGADVSYLLAGPIQSSQVDSSQGLVDLFLSRNTFTNVQPLWTNSSPPTPEANGGMGSITYEEFTASLGGVLEHGLIYGQASVGGGLTTGVVRMAVCTAPQWNSLNGSMIQMAGFIQHDFTQDLQTIQQLNQQFQNFSGQVANFDDVLNSQQLVQDPSTGDNYEAPYSAYQVNGPAGPGYYLPSGQLLNVIPRP